MKRSLAILLALVMTLPLLIFTASAETVSSDSSWYDASKDEFTLSNANQLVGFAALSQVHTFEGKTVKLGADIVLNEGDAASWGKNPPANVWSAIRNFKGHFDGQGHRVSGLYMKGGDKVGFFADTAESCLIENFRLENSYFETTNVTVGSVSSNGGGRFSKIYSNATVVCATYHAGGIFGVANSAVTVENCHFDGSVTLGARYGAAIVGNGNNETVTIRNCLNTGSVYTSHTAGDAHIAGMCGRNDFYTLIENCLNLGKISSALTENGKDDQLGAIFGQCSNDYQENSAWLSHTSIVKSWGTWESAPKAHAKLASTDPEQVHDANMISESLLKGYGAYLNTSLDFETVWCVDVSGLPRLQAFTPAEEIPPLYQLSQPEILSAEPKTEGHYGPRWTVKLAIPDGFTKEQITLGALIIPTAAIPSDYSLSLSDTAFSYRGKEYELAKVEAKIFRESGEGEMIASFVVTELSGDMALDSFTLVPYATYDLEEGDPLTLYGVSQSQQFYQETVLAYDTADASFKAGADSVLYWLDKSLGGRVPVSEQWLGNPEFARVPALVAEGVTLSEIRATGPASFTAIASGTLDKDYFAYLKTLEQFGFVKHSDNGEKGINDSVYTATYVKDGLTVTVVDLCYSNEVHIQATFDQPLSEHLFDNFKADVLPGKVNTVHMCELWWFGNSIIVQLKNGHFILNDGGTDYELPYLLDYLETLVPEGEIPVVDAWFFSHLHYDHSCVVRAFADNPDWIGRIRVNGFYFNEPADDVKDMDPGVYKEIDETKEAIALLQTEEGQTPPMYRITTGQRYYFSDTVVEVLAAQDQISFKDYDYDFNESSTWLQYWLDGQNVVIGGDSHFAGMELLMDSYDSEYLDFDVFFTLHHSSNTWYPFTRYCSFKTVLHTNRAFHATRDNEELNEKAIASGGQVYYEGEGTVVLTFPTDGSAQTMAPNTWKYNGGTKHPY